MFSITRTNNDYGLADRVSSTHAYLGRTSHGGPKLRPLVPAPRATDTTCEPGTPRVANS